MLLYITYIIVIIFLLLFDFFTRSNNRKIALIVLFTVIIISGIRDDVGYDFRNYISFYLLESAPEFGFNLVSKFMKLLGLNYNWMFFLFSFFTIMFIGKGIEQYTSHAKIAFLIYILVPGLYLNSFSIVRQSISIAVLFYGYHFLQNKKSFSYIITVFIATSFHYASLFTIPFFLISLQVKNIKRWMYLFIILISIFLTRINLISIIFSRILGSTRYLAYATYNDEGAGLFKILTLNIFVLILLFFFYKKMNLKLKTMYFFTVLSVAIVTVFGSVGAITRFSYYFRIFEVVLMADIIYLVKNKDARLFLIIILIVGFYGSMFFNALLVDLRLEYFPKITPYRSLLKNII
jgi:hypothetical protein